MCHLFIMRLCLILSWLYSAVARGDGGPSSVPTTENFLRRFGSSVAVIGNYLYIEGGRVSQHVDGEADTPLLRPAIETLSLSLVETWSNNSLPLVPIIKAAPNFVQPALWTSLDEQAFYMWGGQSTAHVPEKRELWKFMADGNGGGAWSVVQPANPDVFVGIKRGRGASWTTCNGRGVALGGYGWARTDPDLSDHAGGNLSLPLPGLLSYELSTGIWANQSAEAFNGLGTCNKGSAVCVPSSGTRGMGILLPLGGQTSGRMSYNTGRDAFNGMDNLTFYDMGTETWHWQKASGAVPPGRIEFCSVILQGPGNTSEIYLYGGCDMTIGKTYGDIYVLSLPGFVWFKLSPSREFPRWGHSCAVGGRSQMIIVGGQDIPSTKVEESLANPDPWPQGIGVFDLGTLDWSDSYRPDSTEYQTPQVIDEWYRAGGLERVNWSHQDTKALFIKMDADTLDDGTPDDTPDDDRAPGVSVQMPTVAIIVGGVLGTLLFLALVVVGISVFRRRRRRQTSQIHHQSVGSPSPFKVLKVTTVRCIKKFDIFELSAETRPFELSSDKPPQELDSTEMNKHVGP